MNVKLNIVSLPAVLVLSISLAATAENNRSDNQGNGTKTPQLVEAVADLQGRTLELEQTSELQSSELQNIYAELDALESRPGVPRSRAEREISVADCSAGDNLQSAIDTAVSGFVRIEIIGTCTGDFTIARDGVELRGVGGARVEGSIFLDAARNTRIQSLTVAGSGTVLSVNNYSTVLLILANIESAGTSQATVTAWSSKVLAGWFSTIRSESDNGAASAVQLLDGSSLEYIGKNLTISASASDTAEAVRLYSGSRFLLPGPPGTISLSATGPQSNNAVFVGNNATFSQSPGATLNISGDIFALAGSVVLADMTQDGTVEVIGSSTLLVREGLVATNAVNVAHLGQITVADGVLTVADEVVLSNNSTALVTGIGAIDGQTLLKSGSRMSVIKQGFADVVDVTAADEGEPLFVAPGAKVDTIIE